MCVGVAPADRLVTSAREVHEGALLVLFGAATGRDGIGGASVLASRTIEEGSEESRPSVQIGDPFAEKLLIEASLELVERDLLEGLQDLGGAGLTCAVSESAARAGLGAELDLGAVPLREPDLEAFEILTSESQERMLALVAPERLEDVRAVCDRWGLASAVVGRLVVGGDLRVVMGGAAVAEVPARSLADEGPVYARPMEPPSEPADPLAEDPTFAAVKVEAEDALLQVLASPNVADKRWVWEQYDSLVQGGTVRGPGGDAA
jgi:phosphoribosylformylglycinamidine synthase